MAEELARRGVAAKPTKIERIQALQLGPKPLWHRSATLSGEELWPEGAVEHYAAVVPLVRQRHGATQIAAITMLGWGYYVDIGLLRRAYRWAFRIGDAEERADGILDYYLNRGLPIFKTMMAHVRSHGVGNGLPAELLADKMIRAALNQALGVASSDDLRLTLAAAAPKFAAAPQAAVDWFLQLFGRIQAQLSLPALLAAIDEVSTEDLLSVRESATRELELSFGHLGGFFEKFCRECDETLGWITGLVLPMHLQLKRIDFDLLLEEFGPTMPPEFLE
jgi:hypothetical protein